MDECGRESLAAQKARVDRFVLPRESLAEICRRMSWSGRYVEYDGEIWSSKYLHQKRFKKFLDEAYGLAPLRMLESKKPGLYDDWCWPCVPRKKCYLSTADNVLDLPTYSFATCADLLDWSNKDILVAALGRRYHKWSWVTQSLVDEGATMFNIQCCKFDPKGERLLLATHMRVEVHNDRGKCQFIQYCKCHEFLCTITAIDWSPTGNSFATGCSRGTICAMTQTNNSMKSVSLLKRSTLVVRVSPNARFVATAGVGGRLVWVLSWPDLKRYRFLRTYFYVKDLHWHPWKTALLGIATISSDCYASVAIWEPVSGKVRDEGIGRGTYSIDSMRFNHRTGELLLSLWKLDMNSRPRSKCSELVVMSDFETVVDHWGEGRSELNRVRTMVFSPDGTKLATATADEDLVIWNFLPSDYKKNITRPNFTHFPQVLDLCANGYTLR